MSAAPMPLALRLVFVDHGSSVSDQPEIFGVDLIDTGNKRSSSASAIPAF